MIGKTDVNIIGPTTAELSREQNLGYGQRRAPLLLQNVKTDTAIAVDIWVENLGPKSNLENYPCQVVLSSNAQI